MSERPIKVPERPEMDVGGHRRTAGVADIELRYRGSGFGPVDLLLFLGAFAAAVVVSFCFGSVIRHELVDALDEIFNGKTDSGKDVSSSMNILAFLWMLALMPWSWGILVVSALVARLPVRRTAPRIALLLSISVPALLYLVNFLAAPTDTELREDWSFLLPRIVELIEEPTHRELMALALIPIVLAGALLLTLPSVVISKGHRRVVALSLIAEFVSILSIAFFAEDLTNEQDAFGPTVAQVAAGLTGAILIGIAIALFRTARRASPPFPSRLRNMEMIGGPIAILSGAAIAFLSIWHGINPLVAGIGYLVAALPIAAVVMFTHDYLMVGGSHYLGHLLDANTRPEQIQDVLRRAVGDPELQLAYPAVAGDALVDIDGHPIDKSEVHPERTQWIRLNGEPLAAVLWSHDDLGGPERGSAMLGVAAIALDRSRLTAQLKAKVREVTELCRRLVDTHDAARQSIERDLHDGAQQQLTAVLVKLGRLGRTSDDPAVQAAARELTEDVRRAVGQIRDLARGVYPAVLTDRGLADAIEQLILPMDVNVEINCPPTRFRPRLEVAAYFVISEALANVAKHASANSAEVIVEMIDDDLVVSVSDDGTGGAEKGHGIGLVSMTDRVEALDGTLEIISGPTGTTILATLPIADAPVIDLGEWRRAQTLSAPR